MKTLNRITIGFLAILLMAGCQEKIVDRYKVNSPVYMSRSELKKAVKLTSSGEIKKPGKIYFKDHYIFINQPLEGIHVIDNSNPAAPQKVTFIQIPGNVDMAIKDSVLFADNFIDLVALDISDIQNIHEIGRVDSIFPNTYPPLTDNSIPMDNIDQTKGIVVGWEVKETEVEIKPNNNSNLVFLRAEGDMIYANNVSYEKTSGSGTNMSVGIGGSMARFTINKNILYTVDRSNLRAFDIDNLSKPLLISNQGIGWNIETVFHVEDKLFFGTQNGMLIYDISNASNPQYISSYRHVKSCDPVVVNGDYAYVTLRAGNLCGEATSQLDIIDISNILAPEWKQSYPMQEPYGLGVDGNMLFVCDGEAGLKIYNANDPKHLESITTFSEVNAYDVIPYNNILLTIASDGLYQYDYSGDKIKLLSHIPVSN